MYIYMYIVYGETNIICTFSVGTKPKPLRLSPTASLTTNSNLSGTLCPGSVQFTCAVTQLTNLRWRFNDSISDVVVYALDSNRAPTFLLPGVTAQLVSVQNTTDVVFADFTSTMTIDIAVLNSISSISCGSPAVTSVLTVPKFAVQGTQSITCI